jgi:tetratricopeptide (TPR) repeat protein
VLGEEHPQTLFTITNLAILYNQMQRFKEAAEMLETSLPLERRVLGMQHPLTGFAMQGLVTAYLGLGRIDDALPLQRELLELRTAQADQEGSDASALNGAAWALLTTEVRSLQDRERALGYAERACRLAEESSP